MSKPTEYRQRRKAFSAETVVTAAVIVAACCIILFPLFVRAKSTVRDAGCANNLRQIGQAIALYSADNDSRFPYAVDASDKFVPGLWDSQPKLKKQIQRMPLLNVALKRYVKSPEVFHCPLDNGGEIMDNSFGSNPTPFRSSPSMYKTFGSSYLFRTEIVFRSLAQRGYWPPADVAMLFDGYGQWHADSEAVTPEMNMSRASALISGYRYNALFGDMHVKNLRYNQLQSTWNNRL